MLLFLRFLFRYRKCIFSLLIIALPSAMLGQGENDSNPDGMKSTFSSWHAMALRLGVGLQRSLYFEVGPSMVFYQSDSLEGSGNAAFYSTFEWTPSTNIHGVKAGGEFGAHFSMFGLELKYESNNAEQDLVITPKLGLGVGLVNVFYGYNISTNNYPFASIGKNQVSIAFNIARKYFRE